MASQSLYRKWRSQTFSDLIGQEAITRTLLNAVREGRLAHAYLFCGPRGTGKTSTARLLAKTVNCANPQNGEPCNECISCREIATGRSPDVIEIDAASNNSVEDIRNLRENVSLLGSGGHHKVYIVDEAHMLSPQAFNALLKTLEEPPPHVIFVLATTEAQKLLATIVSRCQRFDFRRITRRDIVARLNHVAQGEGLDLEPAAAELLARAAQGGLRDALSLLDQAMAYCGARIDLARTREMLGLSDTGTLRGIVRAVAEEHAADGLELINGLVTAGADLRQVQQQLAEEWRALMLARAGADLTRVIDCSDEEAREIADLAQRFSLDELMACARVFARNETPARGLPVPQLALELAFLECVGIRQGRGVPAQPSVAASLPAPQPAPQPLRPPTPRAAAPADMAREADAPTLAAFDQGDEGEDLPTAVDTSGPTLRLVPPPVPPRATTRAPAYEREADPDHGDESSTIEPTATIAQPRAGDAGQPAEAGALINRVRQEWVMIRKVCKQKSPKVAALLNNAQPTRVEAGSPPVLVLHASHSFHFTSLRKPESAEVIQWALEQVVEQPMRVRIELANGGNDGGNGSTARGGANPPGGPASRGPSAPNTSHSPSARGYGGEVETRGATSPQGSAIREARGTAAPSQTPDRPAPTPGTYTADPSLSAPNGQASGARPAPPADAPDALERRGPRETAAVPLPASKQQAALEEEVRNDPLVQELMRVGHVDLAEVFPLDAELDES